MRHGAEIFPLAWADGKKDVNTFIRVTDVINFSDRSK